MEDQTPHEEVPEAPGRFFLIRLDDDGETTGYAVVEEIGLLLKDSSRLDPFARALIANADAAFAGRGALQAVQIGNVVDDGARSFLFGVGRSFGRGVGRMFGRGVGRGRIE